jgi:hypothetical protein
VQRFLEQGVTPGWLDGADVEAYKTIGRMIRHPRRAGESVEVYLLRLALRHDQAGAGHVNGHDTRRTTDE